MNMICNDYSVLTAFQILSHVVQEVTLVSMVSCTKTKQSTYFDTDLEI